MRIADCGLRIKEAKPESNCSFFLIRNPQSAIRNRRFRERRGVDFDIGKRSFGSGARVRRVGAKTRGIEFDLYWHVFR
jgi:hypothetical protein